MNLNKTQFFMTIATLMILISVAVVPAHATTQIALTGGGNFESSSTNPATLSSFIAQVSNGSAGQITGLYIQNVFSYPVVQQPGGSPAFVSTQADTVTQFNSASAYGSLGFLAHNTLAGSKFSAVETGDVIDVVYGDGHFTRYQVRQTRSFQALQPNNPYTNFVDLSTSRLLTVEDVFYQTYGVSNQLILQTCIASQGNDSWGRLFIIATPYTPNLVKIASPMTMAAIQ